MSETPEAASLTPSEFDFDAWIKGAYKPARSVTVYQRGDLIAELDRIKEQILAAEQIPDGERSLGDASPAKLRAKYAEVAAQWSASALVLKITGHNLDEQADLTEAFKAAAKEAGETVDDAEAGFHLLALAIEPRLSRQQLQGLHKKIGEAQFSRITKAYRIASQGVSEPSADFLPKSSTVDDGDES